MAETIPTRDAIFLAWSGNLDVRVNAMHAAIGVPTELAAAYTPLHEAYATAYTAAEEPLTRTRAAVAAKNSAKKAALTAARVIRKMVLANPAVSDQQLIELGFGPRPVRRRSVPVEEAPFVDVAANEGREVKLRLHGGVGRRGRPKGVMGASVFSFVGDSPSEDPSAWRFEGNTGRPEFTVDLPLSLSPGTKVWFTAFWFNGAKQSGPASEPVSAFVQFGAPVLSYTGEGREAA